MAIQALGPPTEEVELAKLRKGKLELLIPVETTISPGIKGKIRLIASAWNAGACRAVQRYSPTLESHPSTNSLPQEEMSMTGQETAEIEAKSAALNSPAGA